MANATRLVRDDAYEGLGASYQCVVAALLDAALNQSGVASATTRREVTERFLFMLGEFHDSGWLRPNEGAKPVYPILAFSEQFLNTDSPHSALGTVYLPSPSFAYHEYALGCAGSYFDGDPAAQIETGSVGVD